MKLPVLAYGHSILTRQCDDVAEGFPGLEELIKNMWETMRNANGCGLAAPQIGRRLRLFIVDSRTTYEGLEEPDRQGYFDKEDQGIRETFINARIIDRSGGLWEDNEGCLSIPGLSGKVERHWTITVEYFDPAFRKQTRTYSGATARMIQHEYDHTEGILYLDYLRPLTKKLMASKLKKITRGQIKAPYPMKFR